MPLKIKIVLEDLPENNDEHVQELSTAILLGRLIDRTHKHDVTLALLAELLGKQQKQLVLKDKYTPRGIPLPKTSDIPRFLGPLGDADKVLSHLRRLQQVLRLHGLLTPLDDEDMEERRRETVIELANNSVECAGMIGWVEQDGRRMEKDGLTTWDEWSAAFKAKAMPSNWEFRESRTLFRLSFHEASSESWRKFDNAVILHRGHLHGSRLYPNDQQLTGFYRAACPERLFLRLVDLPEFHVDDLDALRTLISNHIDRIQHEDDASQPMPRPGKIPPTTPSTSSGKIQLPHPIFYYHDPSHPLPYYRSPAGRYIREIFRRENRCYDCRKIGHQHPQCPSRTRSIKPHPNQIETDLTAGDATSAYLTLLQTHPPRGQRGSELTVRTFSPSSCHFRSSPR